MVLLKQRSSCDREEFVIYDKLWQIPWLEEELKRRAWEVTLYQQKEVDTPWSRILHSLGCGELVTFISTSLSIAVIGDYRVTYLIQAPIIISNHANSV